MVGHVARNDMDTMADTSCAGCNWVALEFTGDTCDVYPYKDGYKATENVPVATCATVVQGEDGMDILIIGHEMLYFGTELDRSLINQNQIRDFIRHAGGTVQDDFTNHDTEFGIDTGEAFIPFYMDGSSVSFDSRFPSARELETLPHVVITSKEKWDPKTKVLRTCVVRGAMVHRDPKVGESDVILWSVEPTLEEWEFSRRVIGSVSVPAYHEPTGQDSQIRDVASAQVRNSRKGIRNICICEGNDREAHSNQRSLVTSDICAEWDDREAHSNQRSLVTSDSCAKGRDSVVTISNSISDRDETDIEERDNAHVGAIASQGRHLVVSAETLSRIWNIGLDTAQKTLQVTTQHGVHSAIYPLRMLGCWLGVSHRVGSALCYWILTKSGQVISSTTVQHVTDDKRRTPNIMALIDSFDEALKVRLDDTNFIRDDGDGDSPYIQDYSPPPDSPRRGVIPSDEEYGDMVYEQPPDDDEHEDLDNYIHAQLLLDGRGRTTSRSGNQSSKRH